MARDPKKYLYDMQRAVEATQRLPDVLKITHPLVPWGEISDFRNILVHNYLGNIDAETILKVLNNNLTPLEHAVRAMLAADPSSHPTH